MRVLKKRTQEDNGKGIYNGGLKEGVNCLLFSIKEVGNYFQPLYFLAITSKRGMVVYEANSIKLNFRCTILSHPNKAGI